MADLTPAPFEDAVHLAASVCAAPLALAAFLEPHRLRIRAATAPLPGDLPRAFGFCARTVAAREPVVIPDTHLDPGAAGNAVLGPPWFARFYAGVPIETSDGRPPGALEIYDHVPRRLEPWQLEGLRRLARIVGQSMAVFVAQRDREARRARIVAAVAGGLAAEIKRNSERLGPSRAADLARQLLALAGHRSLRPQPIDVNALLAREAAEAWSLALDPAAGEVYGDEERLGLAIRGLAARAAGPRRQPVPIATRDLAVGPAEGALLPPGRYVMVTIGAPPAAAMDEFAGWFETVPAIDPGEEGPGPAIAELSGFLIESGGRLGCRPPQGGGPAYCLALPRITGAS
jgi:GAF domain-containing protein